MKKLMVVSLLVVAMVLAAVTCISAADVCIRTSDDLAFDTCLQYQNSYYTGTFRYSPLENLPDGAFYWKLDTSTLKPATDTGYCFQFSNTLDMNMCAEYHGTEFGFAFRYAPTGTDADSILNWKIDAASFKQRTDANQDTVYNYAKDVARSYLEGNSELMMSRRSTSYLNDGMDYICSSESDNYYKNTYTYSQYSYVINSVSYQNQNGKQIAKISRTQSATVVSKSDPTPKSSSATSDATLIFEDDKWKAYGNQKASPGPSVSGIVACESVDKTTWKPVGAKTVFTSADATVYILVKLEGIHNGSVVYIKWYKPDGTLDYEGKHSTVDWGSYPKCISDSTMFSNGSYIKGYESYWTKGSYRVEVYADNVKAGETTFEYTP